MKLTILKKCTAPEHSMANTILLVFEGEKREPRIFESIHKYFFQNNQSAIIRVSYGAEIYQLYRELSHLTEKDGLELLDILYEKNKDNKFQLNGIKKTDIDQIYLFFDYDGHSSLACNEDLSKMLDFFNEETENGKLFISYPMVESLWHHNKNANSCYETCSVPVSAKKYKEIVGEKTSFKDPKKIDLSDWNYITLQTVKKASCIVNDSHKKPEYDEFVKINQKVIFENQLLKFIPQKRIAVLSGIPLFKIGRAHV